MPFSTFSPVVTGVGACIVTELGLTVAGAPLRVCYMVPTLLIPFDGCDCGGQYASSVQRVYGSSRFPDDSSGQSWAKCGPALQIAQVLVQVTRCVPTLDSKGRPPSCDAELAAALTIEADRQAVRRGITCCLTDMQSRFLITGWSLGESLTVGELGGCAGIETVYRVGLPSTLCGACS